MYTRQTTISRKIDEEKNSKVEWIIPNAQTRSMEPVRLTLHPGGSSEIYLPQECEEFGYVIKGTVKLCYGGKVAHRKGR